MKFLKSLPVEYVEDPLGNITSYDYDHIDRVTSVYDILGGETAYDYDDNSNRVSLTDPEGNITSWSYDAVDRVEHRSFGGRNQEG